MSVILTNLSLSFKLHQITPSLYVLGSKLRVVPYLWWVFSGQARILLQIGQWLLVYFGCLKFLFNTQVRTIVLVCRTSSFVINLQKRRDSTFYFPGETAKFVYRLCFRCYYPDTVPLDNTWFHLLNFQPISKLYARRRVSHPLPDDKLGNHRQQASSGECPFQETGREGSNPENCRHHQEQIRVGRTGIYPVPSLCGAPTCWAYYQSDQGPGCIWPPCNV